MAPIRRESLARQCGRVAARTKADPVSNKLATAFLEVANLEARPTKLLHAATALRVIGGNLGSRNNAEATPAGVHA